MYEEIIALLKTKKGRYREISDATGLAYDWLCQVSRGVINDPGIKKMELLHEHLRAMDNNTSAA